MTRVLSFHRWSTFCNDVKVNHCFAALHSTESSSTGRTTEGDRGNSNQPNADKKGKKVHFAEDKISDECQKDDPPATLVKDDLQKNSAEDAVTKHYEKKEKPTVSPQVSPEFTQGILPDSSPDSDADSKKENHYGSYWKDEENFPGYSEDILPDDADQAKLKTRYRAIPEEFYTRSGLRPIGPHNFQKWFAKARGSGLRWHFWEWFSGSVDCLWCF